MNMQCSNLIRVRREDIFGPDLLLYFGQETLSNGRRLIAIAEPVTLKTLDVEEGMILSPSPTMQLDPTGAQKLMDELWNCGLRPSEGSGSAGAMAATQKHLDDMRSIVARNLGVEFPK